MLIFGGVGDRVNNIKVRSNPESRRIAILRTLYLELEAGGEGGLSMCTLQDEHMHAFHVSMHKILGEHVHAS